MLFSQQERCSDACVAGGRCLALLADCPREHRRSLPFGWLVANVVITLVVGTLVIAVVYRGMRKKPRQETSPQEEQ